MTQTYGIAGIMIGLDDELPKIPAEVLGSVFGVDLHPCARHHPAHEDGGELVLEGVVACAKVEGREELGHHRLAARPDTMNESRHTQLESGRPPGRHDHDCA